MALGLLAVLAGIVLLWKAADEFVDGAAGLAKILSVPPLVIGAVVVGFGTSAPEMLVSGLAAVQGESDLGVGNVIGSNIANLSLILGAAVMIIAIKIDSAVLRREAPLATAAAIAFAIVVQGGIQVWEGLLLLVLMVGVLYLLLTSPGPDVAIKMEVEEDLVEVRGQTKTLGLRTLVGLVGTVGGAWILVWGATDIADRLGVNSGFVGLTLVAVGTSLPELVTAVTAARRGHDELIIGNLLGSNLFNSLAVGAVIGLFGDGTVPDSSLTGQGIAIMLLVAIGVLIAMVGRDVLKRIDGSVLLAVFVGFLIVSSLST